jgi:esterase/lipase
MSERHRGFDVGRRDATNRILWIHGYTGSPDAFVHTAERLAKELDAHILAPLLPGHGTVETRLLKHSFEEFHHSARYFARTLCSNKKPFAYLGYSLGGYIAALLAEEFKPHALTLALTPYSLRFPFWIPGVAQLLSLRSFWDKYLTEEDLRIRKGTFYYRHVPGKSLSLIHEGNTRLHATLPKLEMPILTMHNAGDPLAAPDSGVKITKRHGGTQDESHVFTGGRHALFFRPERELEEQVLIAFFKKHLSKNNPPRP